VLGFVEGSKPSSLDTSITLTSAVTAGQTYKFRVRSMNIHNWGDYSEIKEIKAARKPYPMAVVTTSIDSAAGGVTIAWL
jgi:hypothetical protein